MSKNKVAFKSSAASDSYIGLVTQSHLKRSMQEQEQDKESHIEVVSVMMVDVTAEATMAEMERKINFLMKVVEERDHEITALKDQMKACETVESSQTPVVKATDKGKNGAGKPTTTTINLYCFSLSSAARI
ncbi:ty3-gypsy retrotransposon protein [Cucumis melo var. makuwa]|uniref:Ty3-gypsy retrotransposon protein n=1 Tax=Cucumis melo var. makuwa TaxID=1194695 RepID=A0A5A7VLB1_CUCMM|nr:ty3-gypsy retrotransposon protein [Cucumis melo var. makuwa]TYK15148.1 ty3-gypsy retrotransposon protein [Cucumis melo var. makuwa]